MDNLRKKEQLFRGKTIAELKALDVRESAKFVDARSRRSILRGFDTIEKFLKRCEKKVGKNKKIKTHLRDLVIVPKFVGLTISVYNGKLFQDVLITHEMIGHRLGEFSLTRTKAKHTSMGVGATKSSRAQKK
ncbi:MAG: ribosomal protein S19 family protein [Nanoarchaeota archaeon]|nr:ribosomal protein S19 family protein [Nanoarchaeota archaeon]